MVKRTNEDTGFDATFTERAVFFREANALVISDLHVGRGAGSSIDFPLGERRDLTERLDTLLDRFSPSTVVFAGDVLDAFDHVSTSVRETVSMLARAAESKESELILIEGNHDSNLENVLETPIHDSVTLSDGTIVCHGHVPPDERGTRYVIGHDHPAITMTGRKRPCHLVAERAFFGATVHVLPAFSRLVPGTTVNRLRGDALLTPMVDSVESCRPVVVEEGEPFAFPPLGSFRKML